MDKVNYCINCGLSILTQDGLLRCSINFLPAIYACNDFEFGKPKLWKADSTQTPTVKVKQIKPPKPKKAKKAKKNSPQTKFSL